MGTSNGRLALAKASSVSAVRKPTLSTTPAQMATPAYLRMAAITRMASSVGAPKPTIEFEITSYRNE